LFFVRRCITATVNHDHDDVAQRFFSAQPNFRTTPPPLQPPLAVLSPITTNNKMLVVWKVCRTQQTRDANIQGATEPCIAHALLLFRVLNIARGFSLVCCRLYSDVNCCFAWASLFGSKDALFQPAEVTLTLQVFLLFQRYALAFIVSLFLFFSFLFFSFFFFFFATSNHF
jgi:hypothetical protein